MMCLTKFTPAMLAIVAGAFLAMGTATAQRTGGGHGGYLGGRAPAYHGVYYGQPNWNYVVPHRSTYAGGYYSVGRTHYYTPTPIVSVFAAPPVGTTALPVQKPVELTFGGFARYQDLAGRLVTDANALCLDMHHNYQGNKNFAEAYGEAYGVLQAAKYLQGNEHKGHKETIGKRVAEMHGLMHHVMDETRGWTRTAKRQVGAGTLEENMAGVEAVMHHLAYDAGIKQNEPAPGAALPVVDPKEEAPAPARK
ncbi:MAG: hypothetical protein HYX68_17045 [Planctomycetes bacterium]|nr:hypothetical protein [Planctomycetota bacterium]